QVEEQRLGDGQVERIVRVRVQRDRVAKIGECWATVRERAGLEGPYRPAIPAGQRRSDGHPGHNSDGEDRASQRHETDVAWIIQGYRRGRDDPTWDRRHPCRQRGTARDPQAGTLAVPGTVLCGPREQSRVARGTR